MKIIVVAGGQGTKLWPNSREAQPKQFQKVIGDASLCTRTIEILLKRFAPEDIFISTKRSFIKYVSDQAPQIPLKNYIIEPDTLKDTGPGHGLAFLRLNLLYPDEPFFLVQVDCIREPEKAFLDMIEDAGRIVAKQKRLLTGGIKANEPNLGADYLKLSDRMPNSERQEVYGVDQFIYRGNSYRETKELLESYHVVAHCNHYCWYPGLMLEAYKKYRPDWYKVLMKIQDALDKPGEDAAVETLYHEFEKGPTEEVTKRVMSDKDGYVILVPFRWTDVGTWGSVYEFFDDEGRGRVNYEDGTVAAIETTGSLIKTTNEKKLIAVAGVEDLVIVDTEDVLLIVPKDKIEKIKDLQALIRERGETEYL